jgi:hypothetical protein
VRDSTELKPSEYQIRVKGNPVARGELQPKQLLAIDPGAAEEPIEGTQTTVGEVLEYEAGAGPADLAPQRAADFPKDTAIPTRSANRILKKLEDSGLLRKLRLSAGRQAAVLVFPELLNTAEGREVF